MITIDFETFYSKEFSLSKITTEEYIRSPQYQTIGVCVKVDDGPIDWITGSEDEIKQKLLSYHMENETVVAHNAAFDCAILNWRFGIRPKFIADTLSMARPIIGVTVKSVSLRSCAEYFGLGEKGTEIYNTLGKRLEDFTPEELQRFGEYCWQDVNLTWKLYQKLEPLVPLAERFLIDMTIRMFTEPVIKLDKGMLADHLAKVKADQEKLLESIGADRADFMSNDKFAELLRAQGVEPPTKISPTTGKTAYAFAKTDDGFKALLEHENEVVQALASARLGLKSTIEETRTQAFLDIANRGPMPIMLNYYGAMNTGRWSGGERLNPQNLPRGGALRKSMIAPDGYMLVACDSSQVEARTLAWFAGQDDLVEGFRNNEDIYSKFASQVYGRPINKHDNKEERHVGKTCILGLGYGVGAAKLQYSLANGFIRVILPSEECKRIVDLYRNEAYPKIRALWKSCDKAIEAMYLGYDYSLGVGCKLSVVGKDRCIQLPNGLKLQYPGLTATQGQYGPEYSYKKKSYDSKIYGGALTENIIQSLARIVVSYQMLGIGHRLAQVSHAKADKKIRRIVHMVHDEVICCVPKDEAWETQKMMEQVMSTPPKWAVGLPVSCEADFANRYGDAK